MREFKGTQGELKVVIQEKYPFNIQTIDKKGDVVFQEWLYAFSTDQKTAEDALNAVSFSVSERDEIIKKINIQLADAKIRAAAPELLKVLQDLYQIAHELQWENYLSGRQLIVEQAQKAINKALD